MAPDPSCGAAGVPAYPGETRGHSEPLPPKDRHHHRGRGLTSSAAAAPRTGSRGPERGCGGWAEAGVWLNRRLRPQQPWGGLMRLLAPHLAPPHLASPSLASCTAQQVETTPRCTQPPLSSLCLCLYSRHSFDIWIKSFSFWTLIQKKCKISYK